MYNSYPSHGLRSPLALLLFRLLMPDLHLLCGLQFHPSTPPILACLDHRRAADSCNVRLLVWVDVLQVLPDKHHPPAFRQAARNSLAFSRSKYPKPNAGLSKRSVSEKSRLNPMSHNTTHAVPLPSFHGGKITLAKLPAQIPKASSCLGPSPGTPVAAQCRQQDVQPLFMRDRSQRAHNAQA